MKTILLAEDDPAICDLLQRFLGERWKVVPANDGRAAVAAAGKVKPDLLLLDVMMPGLDGFEVARQIRALPGLETVPIVFLTARDTPMDKITGIQSGARFYITKPFKLKDVIEKVTKILGSA